MNPSRNDNGENVPHDELDALLREWHTEDRQRAIDARAALMSRLSESATQRAGVFRPDVSPSAQTAHIDDTGSTRSGSLRFVARTIISNRFLRAAASFLLLVTFIALMVPLGHSPAVAAQREVMLPDGGRLEARDKRGQLIGPCALNHTDVHIDVAGPFTRVNVKQKYHNPYQDKIEAVYTFPLSNRAAVDRMTMTIGDRVIEAEMKERQLARQTYESARNAGYVASLLEQERPNIFTQSVANIEPGADITIEIRYVEMVESHDGKYSLAFPMTVAPRYIPGSPLPSSRAFLPAELRWRHGLILLGPCSFERVKVEITGQGAQQAFNISNQPIGPAPYLRRIIDASHPIAVPDGAYRSRADVQEWYRAHPSYDFYVTYADGAREFGQIAGDGLGHINGRWFWFDPAILDGFDANGVRTGTGYESDTTQVPDASRITPAPVRPPQRAGHDISITVSIDTGGPAIIDYQSDLHQIICTDGPQYKNLGNTINLALRHDKEIPNRDFVLSWKTMDDRIQEATFAHIDAKPRDASGGGGFFTLILAPPAKVNDDAANPRELIFVLDTSGSMKGQPIEKAKAVMTRAIETMRPRDTFNMITFSGDTHVLWNTPRPNTETNRAEAQNFLASRSGDGGTEMMNAINAALAPSRQVVNPFMTLKDLANLPADGRAVAVAIPYNDLLVGEEPQTYHLRLRDDLLIDARINVEVPNVFSPQGVTLNLRGQWSTIEGQRVFIVSSAELAPQPPAIQPLRIVMFMTDGQVGNDDAIIQAVRNNAKTTRVFSFGVGDAPNRNLLDQMAIAGRGEVEYVNLQSNPDEAVKLFVERIGTPVLTDIRLSFSENLKVHDTIPPIDAVPDLFDQKPIIIHGRFAIPPSLEGGGKGVGGTNQSTVATGSHKDAANTTHPLTPSLKGRGEMGTLTIRGNTGAGPYERTVELNLSPDEKDADKHAVIATLWARARVDDVLKSRAMGFEREVIALGERFSIMTPYTSFVAVEKARLTIAGRTVLVPVPVELPEGMEWEGTFGRERMLPRQAIIDRVRWRGVPNSIRDVYGANQQMRYDDALTILDAIQAVDATNQEAYSLREVTDSARTYVASNPSVTPMAVNNWILQRRVMSLDPQGASLTTPMPNGDCVVNIDDLVQGVKDNWNVGRMDTDGPTTTFIVPLRHANAMQLAGELNVLLAEAGSGTGLDRPASGLSGNGLGGLSDSNSTANLHSAMIGKDYFRYGAQFGGGADTYAFAPVGVTPADPALMHPLVIESGGAPSDPNQTNGMHSIAMMQGYYTAGDTAMIGDIPTGTFAGVPPQFNNAPSLDLNTALNQTNPANGGGGGGGRGGGGSIFGDPKAEPMRAYRSNMVPTPPSKEEIAAGVIEIVQSTVHSENWEANGGDLASMKYDNGRFVFWALKDTPEATVVVDDGRAFLAYVVSHIPAMINIGVIDLPPSKPFDHMDTIAIYDVRDLVVEGIRNHGGDPAVFSHEEVVQWLIDLIQRTVDIEGWEDLGGSTGALRAFEDNLIIRNTPDNHTDIAKFLLALRQPSGPQSVITVVGKAYRAQRMLCIYNINDLLNFGNTGPSPEELVKQIVDIIQNNIDPDSWADMGGDVGNISEFAGRLVISTTPQNHTGIQEVLRQLREIRHGAASPARAPAPIPAPIVVNAPESAPTGNVEESTRFRRVIDQRLWEYAFGIDEVGSNDAGAALTPAVSQRDRERDIAVVLSVRDVERATIRQLEAAGLDIADIAKATRVVAGTIHADQLDDLAMLECVRRIEPLR